MGSPLAELVPFALGLVVTPAAIATGLLVLSSQRPVANALAFAAPFALVYALLSAVVVGASQASTDPLAGARSPGFLGRRHPHRVTTPRRCAANLRGGGETIAGVAP